MTASEMFNVPLDQMTPDIRRQAKAINFGVIYGISGFGLARNLRIPRAEAQGFIDRYFERFPGIKGYMDATVAFAQQDGLRPDPVRAQDPHARDQRQGPDGRLRPPRRDQRADPGHGGRRDPPRDDPDAAGHRRTCRRKMLLQVHDELLFEVDEDAADTLAARAKEVMEGAAAPGRAPDRAADGRGGERGDLGGGALSSAITDWPGLKALALSLDLPEMTEATRGATKC